MRNTARHIDAYEMLGLHYMTAIMPAAVRKPKQKASVENTVGNIATAVIASLRHRTYYDVPSLQEAIRVAVKRYNDVIMTSHSRNVQEAVLPSLKRRKDISARFQQFHMRYRHLFRIVRFIRTATFLS